MRIAEAHTAGNKCVVEIWWVLRDICTIVNNKARQKPVKLRHVRTEVFCMFLTAVILLVNCEDYSALVHDVFIFW